MKHTTLRWAPLAVSLALAFGGAYAQTSASTSTSSGKGSSATETTAPAAQPGTGTRNTESRKDDKLARADRKFIEEAAGGGMFEVEAGKMAASKAQSPQVKDFANTLVKDHSQANDELIQIANARHVELPPGPPRSKRHEMEKLGKLSGQDFDRQFVKANVKDHEKDVKDFEKMSSKAKDPELKAWIDKTLPHLREHLQMAQTLEKGGNPAAMGNNAAGSKK